MAAILSGGGGGVSWVKTYRLPEKFIKWQQDVSYRANIGMPGDDISQFREYVISPIDNFASKGSRLMDVIRKWIIRWMNGTHQMLEKSPTTVQASPDRLQETISVTRRNE